MFDENESMQAGRQEGYGEIGVAIQKLMTKRMTRARIAGQVFSQMLLNCENRGAPDFSKALFSVSEWASTTKTEQGKSLPADIRGIKANFKRFRSAMLFWAAFDYMDVGEQPHLFGGDANMKVFLKFLTVAAAMQKRAAALGISEQMKKNEVIEDWRPWGFSKERLPVFLEHGTVVFPKEPEVIRQRLLKYRNDYIKSI